MLSFFNWLSFKCRTRQYHKIGYVHKQTGSTNLQDTPLYSLLHPLIEYALAPLVEVKIGNSKLTSRRNSRVVFSKVMAVKMTLHETENIYFFRFTQNSLPYCIWIPHCSNHIYITRSQSMYGRWFRLGGLTEFTVKLFSPGRYILCALQNIEVDRYVADFVRQTRLSWWRDFTHLLYWQNIRLSEIMIVLQSIFTATKKYLQLWCD